MNSVSRNNGTSGAGYSGIQISDDGVQPSHYNMIITSHLLDDQASKTQEFGIKVVGAADYIVIVGNNLQGNKYGPLSAELRHNIILNNTPPIPQLSIFSTLSTSTLTSSKNIRNHFFQGKIRL